MKSLASSMLVLWLLCWAHCSLSRYGVVMGSDACTCCAAAHEHADASHDDHDHDASGHAEVACGVCDFLTHGATLMQKLPPMHALAVAALAPASWELAPLPVLVAEVSTLKPSHDPPPLRALSEILAATACPVRGPAVA